MWLLVPAYALSMPQRRICSRLLVNDLMSRTTCITFMLEFLSSAATKVSTSSGVLWTPRSRPRIRSRDQFASCLGAQSASRTGQPPNDSTTSRSGLSPTSYTASVTDRLNSTCGPAGITTERRTYHCKVAGSTPCIVVAIRWLRWKVKCAVLAIALLTRVRLMTRNTLQYRSGSWLAWANDAAAHYAAIHSPRQRTIGPAVCSWQTYHRLNQPH